MKRRNRFKLTRRRFTFWLGMGLFTLGEKLRWDALDGVAAAAMYDPDPRTPPEHWTAAENKTWRWFEREHLVDGRWQLTGVTTPINKQTGQRYTGRTGYVDDRLVPAHLRRGQQEDPARADVDAQGDAGRKDRQGKDVAARFNRKPDPKRRARHGRPPSKWLRSLKADEIRIWLKTIEVPEVGVSGMTFWTHLTRDHSFDPDKIEGLTIAEQAKLHAAAHYGY